MKRRNKDYSGKLAYTELSHLLFCKRASHDLLSAQEGGGCMVPTEHEQYCMVTCPPYKTLMSRDILSSHARLVGAHLLEKNSGSLVSCDS